MLLFEVEKQTLRQLRASDPVVADSQGYLKAGFVFTSDWDGLLKVAQFSREDPEKRHYDILLDDFGLCTVPWEVLVGEGCFTVNVYGNNAPGADNKIVTVNSVDVVVSKSGLSPGELPDEPTEGISGETLVKIMEYEASAKESATQAGISQNAAAANQRTTATLAQDTVILAERIASMNSSILDAAEEVKEAARQAEESAEQAMSGTPEGYSKVSDVVIGLAGYKFVIDSKDNGLNLMEVKANE